MSPTVHISSSAEFSTLLSSSTIVVADFYADWCGPCRAIAPTYESLSTKYSKPKRITFTKVNVDNQQEIAQKYGVRAMPTFLIFRSGSVIETIQGANQPQLTSAVEKAAKLAGGAAAPTYSTAGRTLGSSSGTGAGPRTSVSRPYNFQSLFDAVVGFLGLYFTSLFSVDAYTAAENSPFNIHKPRAEPRARTTAQGKPSTQSGKKLGTIADLSGGN